MLRPDARDKQLVWLGRSRANIRSFSPLARRLAGFQLRRLQQGLEPNDWKAVATIGLGVREVRLHVEGEHRVFYVASFAEAVYVLHAFEKKSRKTAAEDLDIGRQRYRALLAVRHNERGTKKQR